MAEAKHSFVDDNPYLVYSPNAETTSEGGSGGGAGFPVIEITDSETGALPVTAGALKTMLDASPVITFFSDTNYLHWALFLNYGINDSKYYFEATMIDSAESPMELMIWEADTASDYPTPFEG